jgi:hypothetical protein
MGPDRAKVLSLALLLCAAPAMAQTPGWHYSPLPGEGDRASLGCARASTAADFTCLAVRCEDDYSVGVHIYSTRASGDAGRWLMTADREDRALETMTGETPYGAKFADESGWLLDRLRQGTFIYLRHEDDNDVGFAYIDLAGSFHAIEEALYWCAPRALESEQNTAPGVDAPETNGEEL